MHHNSTITTNVPVMGVHKPATRSIPAAVSTMGRTMPSDGGSASSSLTPSLIKKLPVTKRRRRRPLPGQPSGNTEKSRCTATSTKSLGDPSLCSNLQIQGPPLPPFEGSQFDDSAFKPNGHRVRSVVGA
jgi:hypothetical protein